MFKKILILTIGLVFIFSSALLADEGQQSEKKQATLNIVEIMEPIPSPEPLSYECETESHNGTPRYLFTIPDPYGDDLFNVRFTVESSAVCTLKAGYVLMYGTAMVGTPDMRIYLWDDDGTGFPGSRLDSIDVPNADLPPTGSIAYVGGAWPGPVGGEWVFTGGQEYHIGWTILPNDPASDVLGCLADNGAGPTSGEARSSENWAGFWGTMLADWGFDYCFAIQSVRCCWDFWDPTHKMHFPQEPDLIGWDVMATSDFQGVGIELADDWQCSRSGPVTDIHWWGSWKDLDGNPDTDDNLQFTNFTLKIYSNIPETLTTPSMPGTELWSWASEPPGDGSDPPTLEAWYDPSLPPPSGVFPNDHSPYWRYDVFIPPQQAFPQEQGVIYWLGITAHIDPSVPNQWGWKSSRDHFMDDATWRFSPGGVWAEMFEPPRYNNFGAYFDPDGHAWEEGYSTNYYGEGWYLYLSGWWNIWFYDNEFTTQQQKAIHIEVTATPWPYDPPPPNPSITFAVNYSTALWSQEGNPPTEPRRPPLPGDFELPGDESMYITREIQPGVGPDGNTYSIDLVLPYNPEWVSIDIMATDVVVTGNIWHECVGTSLDLSFVITGEPGADEPVYDLWQTPADHTTFVDFGCGTSPPIPADFFGAGSDPFDGIVNLDGEPLPTNPPGILGPTDTIVKRSRAASLPDCPSSDQIETEIVALNLVSTAPITVTFNGGQNPEEWDVRVCLSEVEPQSVGFTNFNQVCQEGGTFTANLPVLPKLTFTKVSDPVEVLELDFGAVGLPAIQFDTDGHWQIDSFFDVYVSPGDVWTSNCDDVMDILIGRSAVDLIPGLQAIPCADCNEPAEDHIIPITSLMGPAGCAQHDVWPPHDAAEPIPTLSEWGMILLALLLLAAGTIAVIRRRRTADSRQM